MDFELFGHKIRVIEKDNDIKIGILSSKHVDPEQLRRETNRIKRYMVLEGLIKLPEGPSDDNFYSTC
jgi:hypothetical protein